ncbi:MAG: hypothetical protein H6828_15245 [Planctomycetes bacterium]|nr:hypothetical protein [Planctomycetota bacterium]
MSRGVAWSVHASNLAVGGTGLVYGWMRYLAVPADEFAVVNHPWQPLMQHLHVLAAPLLVFVVGLLWRDHVWRRWRAGQRSHRRSGVGLALGFAPLVLSGYLLQTSSDEGLRLVWAWVHDLSAVAWLALAAVHPFLPRAARAA